MGSRFCERCSSEIPEDRMGNCPTCGATPAGSSSEKNPALAAVLSLFIPGLGQSYNGNALKGIGIFLGVAILWTLILLMHFEELIIGILILWIFGVYDAYRDAKRITRGEISEKKHQMLLFGGGAVVAVVILAVVFAIVFFFFAVSGFEQIFGPVACVPGGGCISPLDGEATCNTTSQCINSAQIRIEAHYYNDAMKFLDRALALDPQNTQALTLMGVARAKSGNLTGAIVPLDRAVAIDPDQSTIWENRGIVQAMSGKNTASLADLETAVSLPGNSSLSWYNLGVAYSLEGNASGAVDAYDHALQFDNNCTSCRQMKGKSLIALGQYNAALGIFDNVTTPGVINSENLEEKGIALAGLKRYEEACVAFDAAIKSHFLVADIWSEVCNETTGRCEPLGATAEPMTDSDRDLNTRVLAVYEDQLKTRQEDPDLWIKRGEILIKLMRYDEAVTSFERSISIKPKNALALNGQGVALFYKGNNSLSIQAFNQSVISNPEFINSWNNEAFVLLRQGNYPEATEAYQKALYYAHQQTDPQGTRDFLFDTNF